MRREDITIQQSPLPPEYRQLEYIEFTGTQGIFIPTFVMNDSYKLYADILFKPNTVYGSGQPSQFILQTNGQNKRNYVLLYENNTPPSWWIYKQQSNVSSNPLQGIGLNTRATITYTNNLFQVGTTIENFNSGNYNNNAGIYIGYFINQWTFQKQYGKMQLFGYLVEDINGNEKLHLYPALRISDFKPGLYDLVNNQFYTNAGTGEFLYA